MKKSTILKIIFFLLCIIGAFCAIYFPTLNLNDSIRQTQNLVIEETRKSDVVVSQETETIVNETKKEIRKNKEIATTEKIKSNYKEEKFIKDEGALEPDAIVEQENISYDGDITGKGLKLLGAYQGLTYYSQADSRWANKPYTIIGSKTQTMRTSACGPTSAAMVVSSSKGAILPTAMAKLAIDNGYRTVNNGTEWSFYSFVADYFDFKDYVTTDNFNTNCNYLKKGYFVICSCGSGLFTSSGHYITLVADKNGIITVYDPYLYTGKFNTASRKRANVKVSGHSVYVTESNFKKYANYKHFWIFSNDYVKPKKTTATVKKKNDNSYIRYVKVSSFLNVRKSPNTNSKIIGQFKNNSKVIVYEDKKGWSRIGPNKWISSKYLTSKKVNTIKKTVGKTKVLKKSTIIYSKSNLTGKKYTYKKNTTIKVVKNISANVDKVKVKATGRIGFTKNDIYK